MTNDNDRIIASARKAARRMARTSDSSYQSCLDAMAQKAGRAHWGAYIADPVPHDAPSTAERPVTQEQPTGSDDPSSDEASIASPVPHVEALRADGILTAVLRQAVLLGHDAIGLERGILRMWTIGGSSNTIDLPKETSRHMHGAMTRLVGIDWREPGPFPFRFEGLDMALVTGPHGDAMMSLKGMPTALAFGTFAPGDRVAANGDIVRMPRNVTDAIRGRPARTGIGAMIRARFGRGSRDETLKEAVAARYVTTSPDDGDFTLGRVVDGPEIRIEAAMPVMVASPPATGKTAGVVMPMILTADGCSLVVHDERDMWEMTSGHRATLGPVHVLNLSGPSNGSLNPLHADWTPKDRDDLQGYVSALCDVIHPDDRDCSAYLTNIVLHVVATARLPSFRSVHDHLEAAVGTPHEHLARRSMARLEPFMTDRVVGCTTARGLRPGDLRGEDRREAARGLGGRRPTTVYIVRGIMGGRPAGLVASVLQTAIWHHALMSGPGEIRADGSRTGPLRIQVLMDGCARLEPMPKLSVALEQGRAKQMGHVLVASNSQGVSHLFDDRHRDDYMSLFGMEIVLSQNDPRAVSGIVDRYEGIDAKDVFSMPRGRHLLGMQRMKKPMWIETPVFFRIPKLLARTFNPRTGLGPRPVETN